MKITKIFFPLRQKFIEIPYKEEYQEYQFRDLVVIKSEDTGLNIAVVVNNNSQAETKGIYKDTVIIRKVTTKDRETLALRDEEAVNGYEQFIQSIKDLKLDMKPVHGAVSLDGNLFCGSFIADDRIDFRELVKVLSSKVNKRVFFEQIGVRDRARINGDLGKCGQSKCCKQFLHFLPSVTMECARVQNLGSQQLENLTGICGKLKCCLNFEADIYRENLEQMPKMRKRVKVNGKQGRICGLDILNKKAKVQIEENGDIIVVDQEQIT
jgi:cell fate regulator YaaT (PSP1 superfamily)